MTTKKNKRSTIFLQLLCVIAKTKNDKNDRKIKTKRAKSKKCHRPYMDNISIGNCVINLWIFPI